MGTINEAMTNKSRYHKEAITSIMIDGQISTDKTEICNEFNQYFTNATMFMAPATQFNISDHIDRTGPTVDHPIHLNEADETETMDIIQKLKVNAAVGYDVISAKCLKMNITNVTTPIMKCINHCIREGIYPDALKKASITPIHKIGPKTDCSNYRPISVLTAINMIFEEKIKRWLTELLDKNNIIHPHQFGFVKGSSTLTAAAYLMKSVTDSINDKQWTAVIFLDIRKAFDCINHKILLQKLQSMQLRHNESSLLKSYLENRTQFVKLGSAKSNTLRSSPNGSPQGSKLSPLLFNIAINDIFWVDIYGEIQLFADDMTIKYRCSSLQELQRQMAHEIDTLHQWLNRNLSINVPKSKYMIFCRNAKKSTEDDNFGINILIPDEQITRAHNFTYLGLSIDDDLRWHSHVNKIATEIRPYVFALYKTRHLLTTHTAELVYFAYIVSKLSYAAPIWRAVADYRKQELRVLQHRAIKSINQLPPLTPSASLFSERLLSADNIWRLNTIMLAYRWVNGLTTININPPRIRDIHEHNTRRRSRFYINDRTTAISEANPLRVGLNLLNQLPPATRNQTILPLFKHAVRKLLNEGNTLD